MTLMFISVPQPGVWPEPRDGRHAAGLRDRRLHSDRGPRRHILRLLLQHRPHFRPHTHARHRGNLHREDQNTSCCFTMFQGFLFEPKISKLNQMQRLLNKVEEGKEKNMQTK